MGKADQLGALIEQRLQVGDVKLAGLGVDLPLADHRADLGQAAPGAIVGLVVKIGDDDFVAGREPRPQSMGEHVHVDGGRTTDHDLVGVGVDHLGHVGDGQFVAFVGAARIGRTATGLHAGFRKIGGDAINHRARHHAAAGIVEIGPVIHGRKLATHEIEIERNRIGHGVLLR